MDQNVVLYLVSLATATVTPLAAFGTKWLIQRGTLASLHVTGKKQEMLDMNVYASIKAADQKYKAGLIKKEERYSYAMGSCQKLNKSHRLDVSEDVLDTLIEAGVSDTEHAQPEDTSAAPTVFSATPAVSSAGPTVSSEPTQG